MERRKGAHGVVELNQSALVVVLLRHELVDALGVGRLYLLELRLQGLSARVMSSTRSAATRSVRASRSACARLSMAAREGAEVAPAVAHAGVELGHGAYGYALHLVGSDAGAVGELGGGIGGDVGHVALAFEVYLIDYHHRAAAVGASLGL